MLAVIGWNLKNGVSLDRQQLEVHFGSKHVVINEARPTGWSNSERHLIHRLDGKTMMITVQNI